MKPARIATLGLALIPALAAPVLAGRMSFLNNGSIRVGVDLDLCGTIAYLSDSKVGENVINPSVRVEVIRDIAKPFGHLPTIGETLP